MLHACHNKVGIISISTTEIKSPLSNCRYFPEANNDVWLRSFRTQTILFRRHAINVLCTWISCVKLFCCTEPPWRNVLSTILIVFVRNVNIDIIHTMSANTDTITTTLTIPAMILLLLLLLTHPSNHYQRWKHLTGMCNMCNMSNIHNIRKISNVRPTSKT